MPEMSGLEALPKILSIQEVPVLMISALTQEGADVTLQALELGAVDFVPGVIGIKGVDRSPEPDSTTSAWGGYYIING
jgi:chemotaxis response regulator CheB